MRVLAPLPHEGFDPTEAAVPWQHLTAAGHDVVVATPDGKPAAADPIMVTGRGLDCWSRLPGLGGVRAVGLVMRADRRARTAYAALVASRTFAAPISYDALAAEPFDGLILAGGHAPGMRPYLEDERVQAVAGAALRAGKPVAAICHGVVVLARTRDAGDRSVLHGRRVTALTWTLERRAWLVSRFGGRWWDRDYYRTYREEPGEPAGYRSVEAEVTRSVGDVGAFRDVASDDPDRRVKTDGIHRDSFTDPRPAFVVRDGNLVTARWPGDAHTFATTFGRVLASRGEG
jgi:putative intracellular protease/amidase